MSDTKNQTEGKEIAEVSDEELALLMEEGKKHQAVENAGDGVKADYILLAKSGTKALKKTQPELYIDGLKIGDFFLQKEKKVLGDKLRVVPLAFITLYQEKGDESSDSDFFGVWNKEQAESYPLVDGSYYNRQLDNGHILMPVNWVMVEVLDHPEIENAVIAYKKTGSRIWRKWKDDAKPRSSVCATLIYEISAIDVANDKNDWTDIGFEYVGSLLEAEKDKPMAYKCLKKSNAIRESYEKCTLIANHANTQTAPKALPQADASETEESYDDEDSGF